MRDGYPNSRVGEIEKKFSFPVEIFTKYICFLFRLSFNSLIAIRTLPSPVDNNSVALFNHEGLTLWKNSGADFKPESHPSFPWTKSLFPLAGFLFSLFAAICSITALQAAWDSLHPEYIATANGGDIHLTDTRANRFIVLRLS